ncbi:MAG TPA: hypothetical protein EYP62_05495 [Kiritimatiellae bacterium]|nr:hypothetical protein [Kiritimatiellia bacterium]
MSVRVWVSCRPPAGRGVELGVVAVTSPPRALLRTPPTAPAAAAGRRPSTLRATSFSFAVAGGGTYDVAVHCNGNDTDTGDEVQVYILTASDLTNLYACNAAESTPETISFGVNYNTSGITGAVSVGLYHKGGIIPGLSVTYTVNVTDGIAEKQGLVLVVYNCNGNALAAKMLTVMAEDGASFKIAVSDAEVAM